jgi:hypothetical protein
MVEIDATRRATSLYDNHDHASAASSTPPRRADLEQTIARLPESPDYHAFLANLARGETPMASEASRAERKEQTFPAEAQKRLDAFRAQFSGPYTVDGGKVQASPMFRMNLPTAFNAASAAAHAKELQAICQRAGLASAVGPCSVGRPTPAQLVAVTQALIDAGKLPPATKEHPTAESRIKTMQWEWGIGVDCAGYTQQAAAAAPGKAGGAFKAGLMGDIFTNMGQDSRFQRVTMNQLRPGDVIHLDGNPVGHNVVVYDHRPLDSEMRATIAACAGRSDDAAKAFLSGHGPFHVVEVDSSWGAGKGDVRGGGRRDVWIHDESTGKWGTFAMGDNDKATGFFLVQKNGPQDEKVGGFYRPKESP